MIYTVKFLWLYVFSLILVIVQPVRAERSHDLRCDSTDVYTLLQHDYGPDQVLVNGLYPEDYILDALGHPFFQDTRFFPGSVILRNTNYKGLGIRYNVYDQNIIISHQSTGNGTFQVMPPNKFISEFQLDDKTFRKLSFEGMGDRFYEVVYDGKMKCLYHIAKKRYTSYHAKEYSSFRYSREIRNSYVVINQQIHEYKSLGSLLNYFPKEERAAIRTFCKKEKINVSKSAESQIGKLMAFCEKRLPGYEK